MPMAGTSGPGTVTSQAAFPLLAPAQGRTEVRHLVWGHTAGNAHSVSGTEAPVCGHGPVSS